MFQPETEDMLPRAAPRPSAALDQNGPAIKPTVPEVSILFNQLPAAPVASIVANEQQQQKTPQSYASWKMQVLPKVVYPATVSGGCVSDNYNEIRSNIYPMRTVAATTTATTTNNLYSANVVADSLQYRRSLESCAQPMYAQDAQLSKQQQHPTVTQLQQQQQQMHQQQRRSLDALSQRTMSVTAAAATPPTPPALCLTPRSVGFEDVLTICAGTQTDGGGSQFSTDNMQQLLQGVASKEDLLPLHQTLQQLQDQQAQLFQLCSMLLQQQPMAPLKPTKDVTTQYEDVTQGNSQQRSSPLPKEYNTEVGYELPTPTNFRQKVLINAQQQQQQNFQTPRQQRPTAQSTQYRANTPQVRQQQEQHPLQQQQLQQQQLQQNLPQQQLQKASTDCSMVMNELALKYLPNDKLNELLHELHISSPTQKLTDYGSPQQAQHTNTATTAAAANTTPLRNIENFEKGPSDMSNASYKYLKKYRLLPEESEPTSPQTTPPPAHRQQHRHNYQQSPLAGSAQQQRVIHENMLDLDAIRRQPKFL